MKLGLSNVKITSDGTALGTHVTVGGETINGVTRIDFDPITPKGFVSVRLEIECPQLDIQGWTTNVEVKT